MIELDMIQNLVFKLENMNRAFLELVEAIKKLNEHQKEVYEFMILMDKRLKILERNLLKEIG